MALRAAAVAAACGAAARAASVDPHWQRVPMVTAAVRAAGFMGGEGAQVVRLIEVSPVDPDLMLMSTDVGGVYRSTSAGASWHPAMVGWTGRAGTGFALDPVNASHVVGVAGNGAGSGGAGHQYNGIHVSFDGAASWTRTLPHSVNVVSLDGHGAVFDPTSCASGMCMRAYASLDDALYRSDDGGRSWAAVNTRMTLCALAVDSAGVLYAAGVGFWVSRDQGATAVQTLSANVTGLTVVGGSVIYISSAAGVQTSTNQGASFTALPGNGLPSGAPLHHICVAGADPRVMSLWWSPRGAYYDVAKVYSTDGGASWHNVTVDATLNFLPWNDRQGVCAYHPLNASIRWDNGGDFITRSDDAGATLRWASNGENAVMVGGGFAFSPFTPNATLLGFQDYAGAITQDGGEIWTWANLQNLTWGGDGYGAYAASPSTAWVGAATPAGWGSPRVVAVTHDGGATWRTPRNASGGYLVFEGADMSYGSAADPAIGFASNWRTADAGATWAPMANCTSVHAHDASPAAAARSAAGGAPPRLFGFDKPNRNVVASDDDGASWQKLFRLPPAVSFARDLAFDWASGAVYLAGDTAGLYQCAPPAGERSAAESSGGGWQCAPLALPRTQFNDTRITSVAVDPVQPAVVYASTKMDVYAAWNSVMRSTDAGASWDVVVLDTPLGSDADAPLQGPHEVSWLRVHPDTRWLWAAGECYGLYKAPPPPQ